MKDLEFPDQHLLNFAQGWLSLGVPAEARHELERLSFEARFHPEALVLRWKIFARTGEWERASEIASMATRMHPHLASNWICLSYSFYRLKRPLQAWLTLLPKARLFPTVRVIPYMLGCFATEVGNEKEATRWLAKSKKLGGPGQAPSELLEESAFSMLSPTDRSGQEQTLSPESGGC